MLTLPTPSTHDGRRMSRRTWLRIGGLALGGLSLPDLLRAEAQSGQRNPARGVIMVLLPGGPTHLDTFDLKPAAPVEIRGEFRPIATNVPGIDLCEHLPRLARSADKLTIIRSLVGFRDDHNTHWCSTGWESHPAMNSSPLVPGFPPGDWPSLGSVLSRKLGPRPAGTARLSRRSPRRVRGASGRSPQHHASRHGPPAADGPTGLAGSLRWVSSGSRCAGTRGRNRFVSTAGVRGADLVAPGAGARR